MQLLSIVALALIRSGPLMAEYAGVGHGTAAYQSLGLRLRQHAPLRIFLAFVDQQDMLHCFCQLWEERYIIKWSRKAL